MDRKRLALSKEQWEILENLPKHREPSDILVEFWRIALGVTEQEWKRAAAKSFRVTDYEMGQDDYKHLHQLLASRARGNRGRLAVELLLLDLGPAEASD